MKLRGLEIIALIAIAILIIYVVACLFTHPFVNIGDGAICIGVFLVCAIVVLVLACK